MKKFFSNIDTSSMLSMKSLYSLINNHFFKSIINPFFSFLFPLIFVAILGLLLGYSSLLGGLIAMPSMVISLFVLPFTIFEFKSSVLLKRIAVTNIKPWMFLVAMISYYFLIIIISTILTTLVSMGLFSQYWSVGEEISSGLGITDLGNGPVNEIVLAPSLSEYFANAQWGGIIWGLILNSLVGSSIGFLVVSFAKSSLILQGILLPILILSQFLSAMVLPISMIRSIEAIWYVTYISPFRYSSGLMNESFNGLLSLNNAGFNGTDIIIQGSLIPSSIFDVNSVFSVLDYRAKGETTEIFGMADKIANLILPFVISAIFMGISLKTFKWSTR
ncbi:MAG: hypothetical protein ACRC8C_00300 [Mycoplasmoidaceae bacterium]